MELEWHLYSSVKFEMKINTNVFIPENGFENFIHEIAAILSASMWLKWLAGWSRCASVYIKQQSMSSNVTGNVDK